MKIQPVSKAVPSPIPTAAEAAADPSLVAPAPSARPRHGIGALVGAGLLGSLLAPATGCTEREADLPAATPTTARAVPDPTDAEAAARAEAAREAVATVVAPILQKALDEEGRGWFGCMAIDPPFYLSENDAIEFIREEFARAGVKLRQDCEIGGFTLTVPDKDGKETGGGLYPAKKVQGNWVFDLATEDGSLAVEFLSREDAFRESFLPNADNLLDELGYDLAELAQRLRGDFSTRTNGTPVAIGLFIDPLPTVTVWDPKQKKRVLRPSSYFSSEEDWKNWERRQGFLRLDALELLREQVRFFLDWAREEGKIP